MSALKRVEYGPARRRLLLFVAFLLLGIAVAVGMLVTGDEDQWKAWPILAFCGFGLVVFVGRLRGGTLLLLDHDGFDDRTTRFSGGRVAWSEVSGIGVQKVGRGTSMVWVALSDVDAYVRRLPPRRGKLAAAAERRGRPPISIAAGFLDAPADDVVAAMTERWHAAV